MCVFAHLSVYVYVIVCIHVECVRMFVCIDGILHLYYYTQVCTHIHTNMYTCTHIYTPFSRVEEREVPIAYTDTPIMSTSLVLAGIAGAVPFVGPYLISVPAILELWLIESRPLVAIAMLVFSLLPMLFVDDLINREVEG